MPVYMRKRQESLDLSKFDDGEQSIDQDFVLDPDKFRDLLPQPYRFIDKILESLLELSFQEIFQREQERHTEETRYKPPIVPTDLCRQVKDVSAVKFVTNSQDEKFVFCSSGNKLIALGGVSLETVAKLEADDLDISHISVARLKEDLYLLATLDDLGLARLFLFDSTAFHLAKILNEEEGEKKLICLSLQLSDDGEFVAMTLQNASTQQVSLEFLRLPTEAWAKEAEQQVGKAPAAQKAAITGERGADEADEEPEDAAAVAAADDASKQPQLKMSPPTTVLRVRPPPDVTSSAASPNFKAVDASGEVIGSGGAHLLTHSHLQLREASFHVHHEREMAQLPPNSWQPEAALPLPMLEFLRPGRHFGHDAAVAETKICAVCVAWTGDHRLMTYPLLKVAKDLEFKPDTVWTHSSPVTCVAVSPCKSLLAVGLQNGNLCVHDTRLGIARHVLNVAESQPIASVFFINPAARAANDSGAGQVYPCQQSGQAAVYTSDFSGFLIDVGRDATPEPRRLQSSGRHWHEATQQVQYPRSHPSLLLRVTRSGAVVLLDVTQQQEVLQFVLPPPYQLPEPWKPGNWTLAAGGRSLVMRGVSEEDGEDLLFSYNLRILIPMANYWPRQAPEQPFHVHCHLADRVQAFLRYRASGHSERQKQLSEIWSQLNYTLQEVQAAEAQVPESPRTVQSIHTSMTTPSGDSQAAKLQQLLQRELSASTASGFSD